MRHKKAESKQPAEPKTRSCLRCKTLFQSEWIGERIFTSESMDALTHRARPTPATYQPASRLNSAPHRLQFRKCVSWVSSNFGAHLED